MDLLQNSDEEVELEGERVDKTAAYGLSVSSFDHQVTHQFDPAVSFARGLMSFLSLKCERRQNKTWGVQVKDLRRRPITSGQPRAAFQAKRSSDNTSGILTVLHDTVTARRFIE